jgi:RHS repeat-associated protein
VADSITTENVFTYDADGNTTQVSNSSSATQYTYDDADRLSSVIYKNGSGVNVSKSTYSYDGLDRLRIITKFTWDTGTSAWVQQSQKKLVYDGMQVIQERDGDDNVVANNIWDGNIGGLEARVVYDIETPANPPQKYFYHYDGSGNVTAVTNDSQQTVAKYDYDAYGNLLNSSGAYASQNPWRFSTKYYDDCSGLYYYGYRFYSPGLGKWINRDPIAESGGLNLYGFVRNDAINAVDFYGLAQFGIRPFLAWAPATGSTAQSLNLAYGHEQLFSEDGKQPASMGFERQGGFWGSFGLFPGRQYPAKNAPPEEFIFDDAHYSDSIMRRAVANVGYDYNYSLFGNNCQTWADRVKDEYARLGGKVYHYPSKFQGYRPPSYWEHNFGKYNPPTLWENNIK